MVNNAQYCFGNCSYSVSNLLSTTEALCSWNEVLKLLADIELVKTNYLSNIRTAQDEVLRQPPILAGADARDQVMTKVSQILVRSPLHYEKGLQVQLQRMQ